jgi:hypothetical protein
MDLERAFKDCFDRSQPMKRFPVFKKKRKEGGGDPFSAGLQDLCIVILLCKVAL